MVVGSITSEIEKRCDDAYVSEVEAQGVYATGNDQCPRHPQVMIGVLGQGGGEGTLHVSLIQLHIRVDREACMGI